MVARMAILANDEKYIQPLLKYIQMSIYPRTADIENPDDQWFVYEEQGEIIGCVAARKSRGEIRHIVVTPNQKRKGVGSQLVECATKFLRKTGYSRAWVQVRIDNEASCRFFEKLGFKREQHLLTSRKDPMMKLYKYVLTI